jgi:hypothetical protein
MALKSSASQSTSLPSHMGHARTWGMHIMMGMCPRKGNAHKGAVGRGGTWAKPPTPGAGVRAPAGRTDACPCRGAGGGGAEGSPEMPALERHAKQTVLIHWLNMRRESLLRPNGLGERGPPHAMGHNNPHHAPTKATHVTPLAPCPSQCLPRAPNPCATLQRRLPPHVRFFGSGSADKCL